MSATWLAPYNRWFYSSDNTTLKIMTVTISLNLPHLKTLHGPSYLPFLNLGEIGYSSQMRPLFETTLQHSSEETWIIPSILSQKNPDSNLIRRVPPLIPLHSTKEQLKKSKNCQAKHITKDNNRINLTRSFTQVIASVANILKIKKAFPALLDKKIIEIHNAVLNKLTTKGRKV